MGNSRSIVSRVARSVESAVLNRSTPLTARTPPRQSPSDASSERRRFHSCARILRSAWQRLARAPAAAPPGHAPIARRGSRALRSSCVLRTSDWPDARGKGVDVGCLEGGRDAGREAFGLEHRPRAVGDVERRTGTEKSTPSASLRQNTGQREPTLPVTTASAHGPVGKPDTTFDLEQGNRVERDHVGAIPHAISVRVEPFTLARHGSGGRVEGGHGDRT